MKAIVSKITVNDRGVIGSKEYTTEIKDYKDYYKHLECNLFDVVRVEWFGHEISIYVDDEGMLKEGNIGRRIEGYPQPLFGNFVITGGVDEEGYTMPIPEIIDEGIVKKLIQDGFYIIRER